MCISNSTLSGSGLTYGITTSGGGKGVEDEVDLSCTWDGVSGVATVGEKRDSKCGRVEGASEHPLKPGVVVSSRKEEYGCTTPWWVNDRHRPSPITSTVSDCTSLKGSRLPPSGNRSRKEDVEVKTRFLFRLFSDWRSKMGPHPPTSVKRPGGVSNDLPFIRGKSRGGSR